MTGNQIPGPALEDRIITEIQNLAVEYAENKALILSEDDLKCHIFRKIYSLMPRHNLATCDAGITGSPLHTEIPFYDEDGKLTLIPDITILNPRDMSILHGMSIRIKNNRVSYGKLPSKEFEFGGKATIIEIKFIKAKKGISNSDVGKIRDDLEKMARLMRRNNRPGEDNNIFGIMVVFNKTSICSESFRTLQREYADVPDIKVVYGSGNVTF